MTVRDPPGLPAPKLMGNAAGNTQPVPDEPPGAMIRLDSFTASHTPSGALNANCIGIIGPLPVAVTTGAVRASPRTRIRRIAGQPVRCTVNQDRRLGRIHARMRSTV